MVASREWHNEWVRKRKRRAIEYLGNKCVVCGTSANLEFDHIDPSLKSFHISQNFNRKWETLQAELDKCQLLCKTHHLQKSVKQNSVEHGEGVSGKRNCPCLLCKAKKAEYMRTYSSADRMSDYESEGREFESL
jgi:hypothetical protein